MTSTVILREVAVSMLGCRGHWLIWLMHWQAKMDSATARNDEVWVWWDFGEDEVWVWWVLRE